MDVVNLLRIHFGERTREKVGLLLVVAFEGDAVAGADQGFQRIDDARGRQHAVFKPRRDGGKPPGFFVTQCGPGPRGGRGGGVGGWFGSWIHRRIQLPMGVERARFARGLRPLACAASACARSVRKR